MITMTCEEMMSGHGTTHCPNGIPVQRQAFGPHRTNATPDPKHKEVADAVLRCSITQMQELETCSAEQHLKEQEDESTYLFEPMLVGPFLSMCWDNNDLRGKAEWTWHNSSHQWDSCPTLGLWSTPCVDCQNPNTKKLPMQCCAAV